MRFDSKEGLDKTDQSLLRLLRANARLSFAELGRKLRMSPPAVAERMKRLEDWGVIRAYRAEIDLAALGRGLHVYFRVVIAPKDYPRFKKAVTAMEEILECHHVTGEYDYLLKVVTRNTEDLESFLLHKLTPTPGVARIHTGLVLREVKNITAIPISKEHV